MLDGALRRSEIGLGLPQRVGILAAELLFRRVAVDEFL
jgi:hypothetical protein